MSITEKLLREHQLIRDYIDKIQVAGEVYGWGERPPKEFFIEAFDFYKTFIDQYHHIKEEEILFPLLVDKNREDLESQERTLKSHHRTIKVALVETERTLDGYIAGDPTQTSIFWRNLGLLNNTLRVHLNREEHLFIPLINREMSRKQREEMEKVIEAEEKKLGAGFVEDCRKTLDRMTAILEKHYGDRYRYLLDSVASKRVNFRAA